MHPILLPQGLLDKRQQHFDIGARELLPHCRVVENQMFNGSLQRPPDSDAQARGGSVLVPDLLSRWSDAFHIYGLNFCLQPSLSHPFMALALSNGLFDSDFYTVVHREKARALLLPGHPPAGDLATFINKSKEWVVQHKVNVRGVGDILPARFDRINAGVPRSKNDSRGYTPEHLIASLRTVRHLSDGKFLGEQVVDSIRYAFPEESAELVARLKTSEYKAPDERTLERARPRFDVTMMLARRRWNRANAGNIPGS